MDLFVARQPILNQNLALVGYEMLHRSEGINVYDGSEPRVATAKVINALFFSPGGAEIVGRRRAFINFPESLLLDEAAKFLPSKNTVIEVLETVRPTKEVIRACIRLRERGYQLALDDFTDTQEQHPLASLADYIKVDFQASAPEQRLAIAERYGANAKLVAEKVESREQFEWGLEHGYSLFQGYFFAKPEMRSVKELPGFKLNFLEILRNLHRPELQFTYLANIIEREPALSYKLLRLANSALYGRRQLASHVHQAMLRIGEDEVKRWLSVIVMVDMASDHPSEVLVSALIRARFCELLGIEIGLIHQSGELFLLGLFSRLDAMFGRSLAELLEEVKLPEYLRKALLEAEKRRDTVSRLWVAVESYERGQWDVVRPLLSDLGVESHNARTIYGDAVRWADKVLHR